jgi:AbrB family looped-hinge helix DNA binding protein
MEATLSRKGQATIPKAVRERLHLKPGDRFKFLFHPDGVIVTAERNHSETGQARFPRGNRRCCRGGRHA